MKSFTYYKQLNGNDCGPTCIKMVAKYYHRTLTIENLRKRLNVTKEGVSLLNIAELAENIGFKTKGVCLTYDELVTQISHPAILHWDQNHFVVTTPKSNSKTVQIADPAVGLVSYSKEELCRHWISTKDEFNGDGLGIALILDTTPLFYSQSEAEQKSDSKMGNLGWSSLYRKVLSQKSQIVQILIAMCVSSGIQLIFPFLSQSIVDTGINTNNISFINLILIAQFVLLFSRLLVEFIRSRLLLFVSTYINATILSDFWIKLMKLPMSYFDTKMTGDIFQRLGDHKRIEGFLTGTSLNILFSLINLVLFSFILLVYDKVIFFIFLVGSVLYFLWIRIFLKFRRQLDYKRFSIASRENTATMQLVYGMQEIKLYGAEQIKRWEWEDLQAQLFKLGFKGLTQNQIQQSGVFLINEGKNILITFFVAKAVLDGQLTLGAMIAIQYIIGQLNSPMEQLINFTQSAQDAKISMERLNEVHNLDDENSLDESAINYLPQNRDIIFNNLSFSYLGDSSESVLKNISFTIPQGKITAIVGMSGSGKTTILKLLLKFYDNYRGELKVGDTTFKHISPIFWRRHCGSVMQDSFIFNSSIAKNITISEEVPDFQRLIEACKTANILQFIESLPLGFNTKIGAEGNGISAGQKQRILIARAVYRNPEYIVFDEATNALDTTNEKTIMENLATFFKEKTVIVVAHRLSTVKHADNIIVLEDGVITEQGTHETLLPNKGTYFNLIKDQLELEN
ncbi:MAG: peptidase domain-containing ABC transporter [Sphingobacteriales bacterium]|nr:peptidase domain-containing ABC transporter [Sphingobacteriales bacterium]